MGLVPLKLSALSMQERFYDYFYLWDNNVSIANFHVHQSNLFLREFNRQEEEYSDLNASHLSLTYLDDTDHENLFLWLASQGMSLQGLNLSFPNLVKKAIDLSGVGKRKIEEEWANFASEFFHCRGRPVPDWPAYVYIQESLGILGNTPSHRTARKIKKTMQGKLRSFLEKICILFPNWAWAARKKCYLDGALLTVGYSLPSGSVSCI